MHTVHTHQINFKELPTLMCPHVTSVWTKKVAPEYAAILQSMASWHIHFQLDDSMIGNNSPYQQVAVICVCHSKGETGGADIRWEARKLGRVTTRHTELASPD